MSQRQRVAVLVAEFMGTAVLAMAVLSMSIYKTLPYFPAGAAGFTLALMVLVIGPISGAHINPAITIGQWTIRKIGNLEAIMYIIVQMLGGLAAWRLGEYLLSTTLKNTATTNSFDWRVFVAEMVGTLVFSFGVAASIKRGYEGVQAAVTMGSALFIGIMVASLGSSAVLNPAVALGIQSWNSAYILGPILGSIVGMNLYLILTEPIGARLRPAKPTARSTKKK